MSNHRSAMDTQTILLQWSNNVRTLIVCPTYQGLTIMHRIINELPSWVKDRDRRISEEFDMDCGYPCCIVWDLEYLLNYEYDLAMMFLYPEDVISHPTVILELDEPYDLGEQETVEDIQEIYPDYVYPYKLIPM